jgi:hypothetical protein
MNNLRSKACWINQVRPNKVVTQTRLCLHLCAYQDQEKTDDHLPKDVTFIIGAWWHHVMKGRWVLVVFSSYLNLFLLELFISILSLMLHSFFLIFIMPCSFLCESCYSIGPSTLLIISSLKETCPMYLFSEGINALGPLSKTSSCL